MTEEEMITTCPAPGELPGAPPVKLRRIEEPKTSSNSPVLLPDPGVSLSAVNEDDDGWEATDSWDDDEPLLLLEDDSDDDSTFMRAQCNCLLISLSLSLSACLFVLTRFSFSWLQVRAVRVSKHQSLPSNLRAMATGDH